MVPSHAAWFAYDDIHDKERKSAPDFFNNTAQYKTPKVVAPSLGSISALTAHACIESLRMH